MYVCIYYLIAYTHVHLYNEGLTIVKQTRAWGGMIPKIPPSFVSGCCFLDHEAAERRKAEISLMLRLGQEVTALKFAVSELFVCLLPVLFGFVIADFDACRFAVLSG